MDESNLKAEGSAIYFALCVLLLAVSLLFLFLPASAQSEAVTCLGPHYTTWPSGLTG